LPHTGIVSAEFVNLLLVTRVLMESSNEKLIAGIQQGDIAAFEELYKRYYVFLCLVAGHIVKDDCDAEEIVSDVFMRLWKIRDKLSITTSIKAYLVKAVQNTSLNYLRQDKIFNRRTDLSDSDGYEMLAWDSDYPLGRLYEKEILEILKDGIGNLPDACREIFLLSRNEDMKYCAIAEKLGISINTVKTQMKIALARLRETVKDYLIFLAFIYISVNII
jgi:RNA polymerase sigma-70 factor (ECF subfamily)